MKFKKEFLINKLGLPFNCDEGILIEDNIIENDRWSILHEIIFKYNDKFYKTCYSIGATEMQDEKPWEYDNEIECTEVRQVEKLVKVWESCK